MNSPHSNNGLWAAMQKSTLESLLNKAKEPESKYEWLQATKTYNKASKLSLELKNFVELGKINERIGYCFFRAALQAETKEQFENRMRLASKNYEQAFLIFQKFEDKEAGKNHAKAMVAYTSSWFEHDLSKMETLLEEWWTLENKALAIYEKMKNPLDIGKTCNNLMEYSVDRRIFFRQTEFQKRRKELIDIGEKAIAALVQTNDKYELARAYCWTAWYYGIGAGIWIRGKKRSPSQIKWLNYSTKALSLAKDVGDGWLIGWSYNTRSNVSGRYTKNFAAQIHDARKVIEYGEIIKDNYMMFTGKWHIGQITIYSVGLEENSEKNRKKLSNAIKLTGEAIDQAKIINAPIGLLLAQLCYSISLLSLSSLTTDFQEKKKLIEKAVQVGREGVEYSKGRVWLHTMYPMNALSRALFLLAKIEKNNKRKREDLEESLMIRERIDAIYTSIRASLIESEPKNHDVPQPERAGAAYQLALIKSEIAKIELEPDQKAVLFKEAVKSWEKCLELVEKMAKAFPITSEWIGGNGFIYQNYGDVLTRIYALRENKSEILKANEIYERAIQNFKNFNLSNHVAETYWKLAINYNILGKYLEASYNYALASKAYIETSKKIVHLGDFYKNYSLYMNAWNQIEKARHYHSIEDFIKAKEHYEKAALYHQSSEPWNYLASYYFAWANVEEAEGFSRRENTQKAKTTFQEALKQFLLAKESIKQKLEEITAKGEKEMTQKLFEASDLRGKYCQTRILMEDAKLLDREGKYLQSSKSYGEAAQKISAIVDRIDVEAERKELKYVAILCQAWEKMASAEEISSSESYLEAAELFEQAKDYCYTRKASLWVLGNSGFCRGLAAGVTYQTKLDLEEQSKAKRFIKSAATNYSQAGFKNASEYAKASLRLFDAYLYINKAESESDQEIRAKHYQMAENLLQIAAGSFMKAKQPEKTTQVQDILANVREEKALAISLGQVMQAPTIASTTSAFAAPTPTSDISVGLENFEHANVQANLVTQVKEIKVGESFSLSVEFVNAGREPALLLRVEDFIIPDFVVVKKPEIYRIEESCLNMKGKQLAPLKLVEVKLTLQPSKKGEYRFNPRVLYLDELGQTKYLQLKSIEIKVKELILEDRVSTGTSELDSLLLGGIPQEYAVALTGPPSDEREYLIKSFLEAGIKKDEVVFFVSTESVGLENLLEKPNFIIFLCNPKPKSQVPDLPNVYKLRSKTDLTNLSISLAKAYRSIDQSKKKRICIEIVSDVLISHKVETTRRWISELITDLGAKGFTMLAVINPDIHPHDQARAIIDLFDGEIELTQTEDPLECKKSIRVKKLRNQDYIKNPICLT